MKKRITTYLSKREFTKNVLTLMTGTTIAQAVPIAVSPILTRIYTPDDFGVLALFMAITAITGAIANAKYEQAIVLPKEDDDAINILVLSIMTAMIFSLLLFFIVLLFNSQIIELIGNNKIKKWLYFIPFSLFFIGLFNSLNYYNIRKKQFKNMAISQITKSTSLSITQVGLGFFTTGSFGLVFGQIISYISGNYILLKSLDRNINYKKKIKKEKIKILAKQYKKFPIYALPSIFLNSFFLNVINFLISSFFSITTLGFYTLTQKIIGIPTRVIGNNLAQVYFQKATEEFNQTGYTIKIFIKTLKKLIILALPIFIIMYFIAEPLFAVVFGEEWKIAGSYAKILIPLAFVRFISSSLYNTIIIHQKQQFGLYINSLLITTIILVFYYGRKLGYNFMEVLEIYSFITIIEYLLFLYLYFNISKNKKK